MKQNFNILAVPSKRAFVVSKEKAKEFKNLKPNLKTRENLEKNAKKFRVHNLTTDEPVSKKVKILKKK